MLTGDLRSTIWTQLETHCRRIKGQTLPQSMPRPHTEILPEPGQVRLEGSVSMVTKVRLNDTTFMIQNNLKIDLG